MRAWATLRASDQDSRQAEHLPPIERRQLYVRNAAQRGGMATRFDIGGALLSGGPTMFSRRLTDSFALVDVPSFQTCASMRKIN
jgi:hypothetical protein